MRTTRYVMGFDTEDDGKGNPYLFAFVSRDGSRYFWKRDKALFWLARFSYEIKKNEKQTIEAWATNLEYDLINLFGEERIRELELSFGKSYLVGARWPEYGVIFRDTMRHIPVGVKALGEMVGLKKLEFNHASLKERETKGD